jgi:hypothetical protein
MRAEIRVDVLRAEFGGARAIHWPVRVVAHHSLLRPWARVPARHIVCNKTKDNFNLSRCICSFGKGLWCAMLQCTWQGQEQLRMILYYIILYYIILYYIILYYIILYYINKVYRATRKSWGWNKQKCVRLEHFTAAWKKAPFFRDMTPCHWITIRSWCFQETVRSTSSLEDRTVMLLRNFQHRLPVTWRHITEGRIGDINISCKPLVTHWCVTLTVQLSSEQMVLRWCFVGMSSRVVPFHAVKKRILIFRTWVAVRVGVLTTWQKHGQRQSYCCHHRATVLSVY